MPYLQPQFLSDEALRPLHPGEEIAQRFAGTRRDLRQAVDIGYDVMQQRSLQPRLQRLEMARLRSAGDFGRYAVRVARLAGF